MRTIKGYLGTKMADTNKIIMSNINLMDKKTAIQKSFMIIINLYLSAAN